MDARRPERNARDSTLRYGEEVSTEQRCCRPPQPFSSRTGVKIVFVSAGNFDFHQIAG